MGFIGSNVLWIGPLYPLLIANASSLTCRDHRPDRRDSRFSATASACSAIPRHQSDRLPLEQYANVRSRTRGILGRPSPKVSARLGCFSRHVFGCRFSTNTFE